MSDQATAARVGQEASTSDEGQHGIEHSTQHSLRLKDKNQGRIDQKGNKASRSGGTREVFTQHGTCAEGNPQRLKVVSCVGTTDISPLES